MHGANLVYIGAARGWVPVVHEHSADCAGLRPGDHLLTAESEDDEGGHIGLSIAGAYVGTIPETHAAPYREALEILGKSGLTLRIRGRVEQRDYTHEIFFEDADPGELRQWAARMERRARHGRGRFKGWGMLSVGIVGPALMAAAAGIPNLQIDDDPPASLPAVSQLHARQLRNDNTGD